MSRSRRPTPASRPRAALALAVALLAPFAAGTRPAAAQATAPAVVAAAGQEETRTTTVDLARRQANFAWDGGLLRASFSYRDAVTPALVQKLSSGLPTVVAMRAYVLREGDEVPVALAARSCRVVYDLWDEVYRVKLTGPGGERDVAVINVEGVMRQCAEARDLPVVDRAVLKPSMAHYLGVIVDVNPVSPQMLEQIRRWIARPTGSTSIGPSDALFGSFVGLFLHQIGASDRTLRFRTQSFKL